MKKFKSLDQESLNKINGGFDKIRIKPFFPPLLPPIRPILPPFLPFLWKAEK